MIKMGLKEMIMDKNIMDGLNNMMNGLMLPILEFKSIKS